MTFASGSVGRVPRPKRSTVGLVTAPADDRAGAADGLLHALSLLGAESSGARPMLGEKPRPALVGVNLDDAGAGRMDGSDVFQTKQPGTQAVQT